MGLFSLISSLPQLTLFEPPAVSSEKFLSFCSSCLPAKEIDRLRKLKLTPSPDFDEAVRGLGRRTIPCAYGRWESALRNSIARIRAARRAEHGPAERMEAGYEADADSVVRTAFAARDPLEREKILDRARWNKLDELAGKFNRHGFTMDAVYAYRFKLLIAEKWAARKEAGAADNLERAAVAVRAGTSFAGNK